MVLLEILSFAVLASYVVRLVRFIRYRGAASEELVVLLLNFMLGVLLLVLQYTSVTNGDTYSSIGTPLGIFWCALTAALIDLGFSSLQNLIKRRLEKKSSL